MNKRVIAAMMAVSLLGGCAANAGPGEFGSNKTTMGGLLGAVGGGLLGANLIGGKHGAIGKGSKTQMIGVAAGTLLGALAGSSMGSSLDKSDALYAQRAHTQATAAPIGQSIAWSNPDSGHQGTVVATREGQNTATGEYCREFQQTVQVGGEMQRGYGVACRQPDGSWRIAQ
jgi:surface antigen